jgi:hypothetical protein
MKELDKSIKNIPIIQRYYQKILLYILPYLEFLIIKTDLFYIIFWLFPRIVLLFVLLLDVFVFYKFDYRYKFILIGLLLLFNRCFKYSLKNTKNQITITMTPYVSHISTQYYPGVDPIELAEDYDPNDPDNDDIPPTMGLPLDVFIEHQTNSIVYHNITNNMEIIHSYYSFDYFERLFFGEKLPDISKFSKEQIKNYRNRIGTYSQAWKFLRKKMTEIINPQIHLLLRISVLLEFYYKTSNKTIIYKYVKIVIYTFYLICWLYVFIISVPKMSIEEWNKLIILLDKYKDILLEIW